MFIRKRFKNRVIIRLRMKNPKNKRRNLKRVLMRSWKKPRRQDRGNLDPLIRVIAIMRSESKNLDRIHRWRCKWPPEIEWATRLRALIKEILELPPTQAIHFWHRRRERGWWATHSSTNPSNFRRKSYLRSRNKRRSSSSKDKRNTTKFSIVGATTIS